jgi:hypothetical protein
MDGNKSRNFKYVINKYFVIMNILRILFRILIILVILFLVTRIFKKADEKMYGSAATSVFSRGNAPDSTRKEVIIQLHKFQEGYIARDTGNIAAFMKSLYSENNILILGTMPREIFNGFDEAARLVRTDWESWGDCRFAIDNANISSNENTVWIATNGYVKFDLTKLLVIPLRLTAIMVKEDGTWKFQQQQFQFDTDFSFSLLAALLLFAWLAACVVTLFIMGFRSMKTRSARGRT